MSGRGIPVAMGDVLLGKYRVERVLGKGGMGVVVAARHLDLDELFAVKLMLDPEASPEAIERFLREARAAAKLKGEHVARVQDVGRLPDDTPYMIMEYLEGSDLKRVLRERGPLPVAEAATYVLQACETLSEAHSLGIIHRDVKPANMFLTRRRNGSPCLKVLDFGISKHTRGDVTLTTTATFGGSPLYMSPEQMRSAKHVDGRTDVWSIGVVLYELLTGTSPFRAETITAVAGRVLQDDPPPPSLVVRDIPPSVDAVVMSCLAKRPEDRFATMDDLIAALRAALAGRPVVSGHEEPPTLPLGRSSMASIAEPLTGAPARSAYPLSTGISAQMGQVQARAQGGHVAPPAAGALSPGSTSAGLAPTSVTQAPSSPRSRAPLFAVLGGSLAAGMALALVLVVRGGDGAPDDAGAAAPALSASPGVLPAPEPAATSVPSVAPAVSATASSVVEAAPQGAPAAPTATVPSAPAAPAAQKPATPKSTSVSAPPAAATPTATGGKKRRTID